MEGLRYKSVSGSYSLDKLDIFYRGGKEYCINATVSGKWYLAVNVPYEVYSKYRTTVYTNPAKAKNYLLDQLSFDGYPFSREDFKFIEIGEPLSKEAFAFLDKLARSFE